MPTAFRPTLRLLPLAAPWILGALLPALAPAQAASFRFSGYPNPGKPYTFARGLSRDGKTTFVRALVDDVSGQFDYLWTAADGLVLMPNRPSSGTLDFRGITPDGTTLFGRYGNQAATWRFGEGIRTLGVASGYSDSAAAGASFNGAMSGGYATTASGTRAVRWVPGRTFEALPAADRPYSAVSGVSDNGNVLVGYTAPPFSGGVPALWSQNGALTDLPLPPAFGATSGGALAASANGSILLGEYNANGERQACLWSPAEGWRALGKPSSTAGSVFPRALSADGSVVVGTYTTADTLRAFVWDRAHGMRDLAAALVEAGFGAQLAGWRVEDAVGVTVLPSGAVVVAGQASTASSAQAFVATLPSEPTFTPLGDFAGGAFDSQARGLSLDGETVVGVGTVATGKRAFVWRIGRGMFDIGAGALDATGVSRDGRVLSGLQSNASFIWREGGTNRGLGTTAIAEAISANGVVAVGSRVGTDGVRHAHRWNGATTEQYKTYVGTHVAPSRAYGTSADGVIFVGATAAHTFGGVAYNARAYRWTNAGAQAFLGDLPGGRVESEALAISADGATIVGWSHSSNGPEAFRWTAATGMRGLGDLPSPGFASRALAVSENGAYIVGSGVRNNTNRAFLWSATGGMRDLKELLLAAGASEVAPWILSQATGVTTDATGRIYVTGTGLDPMGRRQAFHASLPKLSLPPTVP